LVIHSVEDIRREVKARQPETLATMVLMRHGETTGNVANVVSADEKTADGLTKNGQEQVRATAALLKEWVARHGAFDAIVASPFPRTQETAKLVSEALGGVPVHNDARLIEVQALTYNNKPWKEYLSQYKDRREQFTKKLEGVETLAAVRERVGAALYEINTTYAGKRVLIVSHGTPLRIMSALAAGQDTDEQVPAFNNAEMRALDFVPLPHNARFELDFHRPYIDAVRFKSAHGGDMLMRVPDVFDCWFESGSMPFASVGYIGTPVEGFHPQGVLGGVLSKVGMHMGRQGFPADFIAEGLDQTRGWFYSMLVLGVALFGESPYKHVVVNGLVLAEDGKKMSKKLKNYPDPRIMVEKYGADAIRYFLVSSSAVAGEEVRFTEKNVDEVVKKIINRLDNVVQFYELYKGTPVEGGGVASKNVLDIWLTARFKETLTAVTRGLDAYELHEAARPIADFIDDLSVWYVRRSRDRFKAEPAAVEFLRQVLADVAVVIAPFMPFLAEDIFARVAGGGESVHMQAWPKMGVLNTAEKQSLELMRETRKVVTEALDARTKAGVKVRQPLALLTVRSEALLGRTDYLALIQDEVNVKEVKIAPAAPEAIALDTVLTSELIDEGRMRQFTRALQDVRKEAGLAMNDAAILIVKPSSADAEAFLSRFHAQLEKATRTTLKVVSSTEERGGEGEVKDKEEVTPIDIDGLGYTVMVG
jgi:isoleucyl-tRNA synthetase